jgi:hypothetical protein
MEISISGLVTGSLAVWRLTHLFHAEDGPWDALARLRRLAGHSAWGKMLDCFYCLSVWMAVPFAAALGATWKEGLLLLPALSGAAILLERVTTRMQNVPLAEWHEETAVLEREAI